MWCDGEFSSILDDFAWLILTRLVVFKILFVIVKNV